MNQWDIIKNMKVYNVNQDKITRLWLIGAAGCSLSMDKIKGTIPLYAYPEYEDNNSRFHSGDILADSTGYKEMLHFDGTVWRLQEIEYIKQEGRIVTFPLTDHTLLCPVFDPIAKVMELTSLPFETIDYLRIVMGLNRGSNDER